MVGPNGEQVGIVRVEDALRLAAEADLDLVEVAPMARPPVAKLMDYGKFKYEAAMKAREARKNQSTRSSGDQAPPEIDPHERHKRATSGSLKRRQVTVRSCSASGESRPEPVSACSSASPRTLELGRESSQAGPPDMGCDRADQEESLPGRAAGKRDESGTGHQPARELLRVDLDTAFASDSRAEGYAPETRGADPEVQPPRCEPRVETVETTADADAETNAYPTPPERQTTEPHTIRPHMPEQDASGAKKRFLVTGSCKVLGACRSRHKFPRRPAKPAPSAGHPRVQDDLKKVQKLLVRDPIHPQVRYTEGVLTWHA